MIEDTRLGTANEVRGIISKELLPVFDYLRAKLHALDPQSTETPSIRERALYFTLGRGKMTDGYVYIMGHEKHINLGFCHGVDLPDPACLLTGTGKKLRHVKIHSITEAENQAIQELIVAAHEHMMILKGRP
jgi:hypothetical protein